MLVPFKNLRIRVSFVFLAVLLAAAVTMIAPRAAWGQATNAGTITGSVTDSSNAIVPDATVTITQTTDGRGAHHHDRQ